MVQPALSFEPETVPGLPGPAVGPKGPKIGQKPEAGFIMLSSLRSAQVWSPAGGSKRPPAGRWGVIRGGPESSSLDPLIAYHVDTGNSAGLYSMLHNNASGP